MGTQVKNKGFLYAGAAGIAVCLVRNHQRLLWRQRPHLRAGSKEFECMLGAPPTVGHLNHK